MGGWGRVIDQLGDVAAGFGGAVRHLWKGAMAEVDWHSDAIRRDSLVNRTYKSTQNVRRFTTSHCGADFKFDRPFMAWIRDGTPKTVGDVAHEWLKRRS